MMDASSNGCQWMRDVLVLCRSGQRTGSGHLLSTASGESGHSHGRHGVGCVFEVGVDEWRWNWRDVTTRVVD